MLVLGWGDSGGAVDGDGASGGEPGQIEACFSLKNESHCNCLPH